MNPKFAANNSISAANHKFVVDNVISAANVDSLQITRFDNETDSLQATPFDSGTNSLLTTQFSNKNSFATDNTNQQRN
jgi:hypothetical protein